MTVWEEREKWIFGIWNTGNRPYPEVSNAIWRARTQARAEVIEDHKQLRKAAQDLIDDVRRRYPGEELRCPYMIALDRALQERQKP